MAISSKLWGYVGLCFSQDIDEFTSRLGIVGSEIRVRCTLHTRSLGVRQSWKDGGLRLYGRFGGYNLHGCSGNHSSNKHVSGTLRSRGKYSQGRSQHPSHLSADNVGQAVDGRSGNEGDDARSTEST